MKHWTNFIIIGLINLLIISCVPSLVYSPSINLPAKPLEKGQVQILGGVDYLPETRPENTDEKMSLGGEVSIRYALNNNFSVQLKGWKDISNYLSKPRYGFSISTLVVLSDLSDFQFGIFPAAAFALAENKIEGGGGSLPICVWYRKFYPISFYSAFGPAVGIRDITDTNNQWGWALLFNLGTSVIIEEHFTINLEVVGIKQVNEDNGEKNYFFSPSLNIGLIF